MCCVRYGGIDWRIASTSDDSSTIAVVAAYAPSITIAPPSGFPRSVATSVARTRITVTAARMSALNVASLTRTSPSGRSFGSIGAQILVVHGDRRPGLRDNRRSFDRSVADDDGAVGVPAAHHAAVQAEIHDVAALERTGAGEDLRRELHALTSDPGDQHLSFHPYLIP